MTYLSIENESKSISHADLNAHLKELFSTLGEKKKVLILPPDITRFYSKAGEITEAAWKHYGKAVSDIMPALGTHAAMPEDELRKMFGDIPHELFREHDWQNDLVTLGEIPSEEIYELSEGKLDFSWPAQVNRLLVEGDYDLILSVGQVVPHEVIGMANYTKNIFVGCGGRDGIDKSHYLGAVYGMERIMGRIDTPVRKVLDASMQRFGTDLPIVYILTVVAPDDAGYPTLKGLFSGDDRDCFEQACDLALKTNFKIVEKPFKRVVVYLDPMEFKSTWLGNKSIYRTRLAIEDGGELIVLAPGVHSFGESSPVDQLIRKYGYRGSDICLNQVAENNDLQENLSVAAHLIHGSHENRFSIRYCSDLLSRNDVEAVGFEYGDLNEHMELFDPLSKTEGYHIDAAGDEFYYISNPALGLWASKDRLGDA